jgi:hypothetical protein
MVKFGVVRFLVFPALILVGVKPTFVVRAREIIVVVGEIVEHEFAFPGVVFVIGIAVVVGFGVGFRRINEAHVVEGVRGMGGWMGCWKSGLGARRS